MAPFLSEVFHFHQPGQLRSPGRSLQNAAALGSPIRRPHFAVYGDYSRAPSADRLAPAHLGVVPHPDHAGILRRSVARLSSAHGHKLRLLRNARTNRPQKNLGRRGALSVGAANHIFRLHRSPQPPPLLPPPTPLPPFPPPPHL